MPKIKHDKKKNKEKLLKHLTDSLGNIKNACLKSKMARSTFYVYYKDDKKFQADVDLINEIAVDHVESKLMDQINNNNIAAIIFYLKCKAKARGYVERQEITGKGGDPIVPQTMHVTFYIPKNGREKK